MKSICAFFCLLFYLGCLSQEIPESKKIPSPFRLHGTTVEDDYSWLENYEKNEVKEWVAAQNLAVESHYDSIPGTNAIASKIKEYDFLSTNGLPVKQGAYFYSKRRAGKGKPSSLCYRKSLNSPAIELVNPSKIYKNGDVVLTDYKASENSRLLAYQISPDGSDRHEIRFVDIDALKNLDDVLGNVKFTDLAWNIDKGIFYKKNSNQRVFTADSTYQLFYHKIGTAQEQDQLVFDTSAKQSNFSFFTRENNLFIIETDKTETTTSYYSCLLTGEDFVPEKFITDDTSGFRFLHYSKGRIYFSSKDSDWGEIRYFQMNDRAKETLVIPQIYTHLLVDSFFYDGYIICKYKASGKNYMIVYDQDGAFIRKFDLPYNMDFRVRFLDSRTKELYVSFYSYTISYLNYKLNLETGKSDVYYNDMLPPKPTLFPFDYFETKNITYKSRDNTDIPITIVHKKGLVLDGNNPALLKAYGGFGTITGPYYDTGLLYFLEKGGVFAFADVRGGGEKGLNWHRQGKGLKKMNSFTDFIDAAEFLIREKYTSSQKLAITGTSQGGLLVGVAMTQRPDLFKVAIPKMGVYDMVKFGQYTVGNRHLDEYGDVEKEDEFRALLAYSPYHNIKENVNYPATLIITSENDDRVPPIHAYKFAARLQGRQAQKNPVYLKTLSNSGHAGKVSNYQDYIEEQAAFYSFLLYHLGV